MTKREHEQGNLIGRETEQDILLDLVESSESEFACVYGRRRVGKTFLVEETFASDFAFYATASEKASNAQELAFFGSFLARYGAVDTTAPASWLEAFKRLATLLEGKAIAGEKLIVFLDELPWYDKRGNDFMLSFSLFWNAWASKRRDVLLIVCGSATSWIIEKVLEDNGDLFNRVSERIFLAPFTLAETKAFLESRRIHWDDQTILQCYMVFGGLPYYLKRLRSRKGLAENITELCLKEHARFKGEYTQILESSFRNTTLHREILEVLSTTKTGMSRVDIRTRLGRSDGGALKKALAELEECGYIRRYRNEHSKSVKWFYQLMDPFFMFALTFINEGAYNQLIDKPPTAWSTYMDTPSYYAWREKAFELVCTMHADKLVEALRVGKGVSYSAYAWNSRRKEGGAQIDLVIECSDHMTYLCEMKYESDTFKMNSHIAKSLRNKESVFREEAKQAGRQTATVMVFAGDYDDDFDIGTVVHCIGLEALFG